MFAIVERERRLLYSPSGSGNQKTTANSCCVWLYQCSGQWEEAAGAATRGRGWSLGSDLDFVLEESVKLIGKNLDFRVPGDLGFHF